MEADGVPLEKQQSSWRLATVTKVEEMKLILNMIPIWVASLPFEICVAQAATFFIKQSTMLDRILVLVPILRRVTGTERGIHILQRIGIGMHSRSLTMVVAALVERKRLRMVQEDPVKGSTSMSVFWLAPKFLIIRFGDGFTLVGLQEYFYDQVPDTTRSLGIVFYLRAANFVSSLLITVVDHPTRRGD